MKSTKIKILGFAIIGFAIMTSCKESSSKQKPWTQEQRIEFLKDCTSSAKASYEKRGEEPNREIITNICSCAGQKIEEKYSYEESSKISDEELKNFVTECASEK